MSSDDEFMEIINNGDLEDITEANLHIMQIKDLHLGLREMTKAVAIITEFIYDFFISYDDDEEHPSLTTNAIIYAKDMFNLATKFCEEFYDGDDDDEDFDDDDDDDDDGDDEE